MVEETADKPLSRTFGIPGARTGSVKNNESDIVLLRKRIAELEERFQGFAYRSTSGNIPIATSGTYVDIPFTGDLSDISVKTGTVTGKLGLKNLSRKKYLVRVQATFDAAATGAGAQMGLRLVLNGTAITGAECRASTTAAGVIAKLHSFTLMWVEPGDEVTMQAANFTNTNDITFERGRIEWHRLAGVN
jgi:hypothetical protein